MLTGDGSYFVELKRRGGRGSATTGNNFCGMRMICPSPARPVSPACPGWQCQPMTPARLWLCVPSPISRGREALWPRAGRRRLPAKPPFLGISALLDERRAGGARSPGTERELPRSWGWDTAAPRAAGLGSIAPAGREPVCPSVCVSECLCVRVPECPSARVSVCLSVRASECLCVRVPVCLSVRLSERACV